MVWRPADGLNVMTKGTRNEIIAEIMDWSATWGSPLSREQAEAKADQTIKAARPRWGWPILFYDRRDSLGLVYRFSYRQVLAHRLCLVVAQQLRHGA